MSTMPGTNPQGPALAAMKDQRARDAAQAMREYEADRLAVQAKSERLRALRLAQEALDTSPRPPRRRTKQDR